MQRLVLFAKRPRLGQVKTRLAPPLRPEQALELYRAFLDDQIRFLRSFRDRCDVELCLDGPWTADAALRRSVGDLRPTRQGPGDLGRRMLRAMERASRDGSRATVLIGADSPTMPAGHIVEAFDELRRGAPGVISPADDGGFVLIGLCRPEPTLFREVPWGRPEVFEVTLERARAAGIELRQLRPWYDIDDEAGLCRLRDELSQPTGAGRAPATARVLARLDSPDPPVL